MAKAQVMILGSFHFQRDGVDYWQARGDGERYQEVAELASCLAEYRPTQVLVECLPENREVFSAHYRQFLQSGEDIPQDMDQDEAAELGFLVGKYCGLAELSQTDHSLGMQREETLSYARKHCPEIVKRISEIQRERLDDAVEHGKRSLAALYSYLNSSDTLNRQYSGTMLIYNQIGAMDNYIGSEFVTSWYNRNLRIFAKLQKLAGPGERVLAIMGIGHCAILNQLVRDYDDMDFVSPLSFLR